MGVLRAFVASLFLVGPAWAGESGRDFLELCGQDDTWSEGYCVGYIAGYVAAAGTTFSEISRTAGCRNLAAERGLSGHAPLEVEQLLAWDPEVLVVQCPRSGCQNAVAELTRAPGLGALAAVARGDVIPIDARALTSTGAGMLDAVRQLRDGLRARPAPSAEQASG